MKLGGGRQVIHEDGKKAVIYLRVSSEEQVDNFSLSTQEDICRKEAEKRGYAVVEVFREEGRSAKSISGRPVLISMLEYCRKNKKRVHAIITYRLDRISRQTADYLAIRKKLGEKDITIISATEPTGDSPTEKLVETILAGFAQLDNDIRSERARNGLRARYLSGLISGKCPLGYRFEGGFAVKDPDTWDKVKKAWDLMATGTKSTREMANIMNEWGLRIKRGKRVYKLRSQTTCRIFRLKFYAGILTSNTYPEEPKGQHVPMITEEHFYRVQAILDGRNPNKVALAKRTFEHKDFPLRRVARCGKCGMGLTGAWSRGTGGKYAYYWCGSKCNHKSIKAEALENSVIEALKSATPKEECLNLFIAFLHKTYHERNARLQKVNRNADKEIEELKATRKTLVEKNLNGIYSDEIFREQNVIIEDKMTRAQIMKEDTKLDSYNIDKVTSFMKTLLADLGETYKNSSIPQLKVLISSVFATGVAWNYDGTLNYEISPIYRYIEAFGDTSAPSGAYLTIGGGTSGITYFGGNVGIGSTTPGNVLDLDTASLSEGIELDNKLAMSGYSGDAWLRLNQSSDYTNGIYTPGVFRADGEIRNGSADYGAYGIQTSGSLYANGAITAGGIVSGGTLVIDATGYYQLQGGNPVLAFDSNDFMQFARGTNRLSVTINAVAKTYVDTGVSNWTSYSDGRLKTNVETLDDSTLEKVLALNPVTFNWKDANRGTRQELGFIAQEVEAVGLTHVVDHPDSEDEYYGITYSQFAPYLVKAIQQQQNLIVDLGLRIDETGEVLGASTSAQVAEATVPAPVIEDLLSTYATLTESLWTFSKKVVFAAEAKFTASVEFVRDVTFNGAVRFGKNSAGTVTLTSGVTKVRVRFGRTYTQTPNVYITSQDGYNGKIQISAVDSNSFTLELSTAVDQDVHVQWLAVLAEQTAGDRVEVLESSAPAVTTQETAPGDVAGAQTETPSPSPLPTEEPASIDATSSVVATQSAQTATESAQHVQTQ